MMVTSYVWDDHGRDQSSTLCLLNDHFPILVQNFDFGDMTSHRHFSFVTMKSEMHNSLFLGIKIETNFSWNIDGQKLAQMAAKILDFKILAKNANQI